MSRYLRQRAPTRSSTPRTWSCSTTSSSCSRSRRSRICCSHDLTWQGAGRATARPARRLVGVELHDLGHERARPRRGRRCGCSCSAIMFASLVMAVAIPDAFGEPGAALRRCVRRDPGRSPRLPHLRRRGPRLAGARAGAAHPDLVLRRRRLLARGRARLRRRRRSRCGSSRSRSTTRRRSSSTGCPGVRSSSPPRGTSRRSHFAERFQLFIIIALGESIVVTGATTSQLSLGVARLAAFGVAFLITAAFWWLYFSYVAAHRAAAARARRPSGRRWRATATRTSTSCSSRGSSSRPSATSS